MKFSHGAWLWEKGVTPHCVKRVVEHRLEKDALVLAAVDKKENSGADSFEGTVLEMRVTSPMSDVIRVRVGHHRPRAVGVRGFDLDYSLAAAEVKIESSGEELRFVSGKLSLRISKGPPWSMRFEVGDCLIAESTEDGLGQMSVATPLSASPVEHLMQRLSMGVGECVYGLGERFGPLVKNGQSVVIWNEDGGTVSDLAYKNVPFYLSSRGYGLLVNTPGRVEFEVATERVSQMQFSVAMEELDYYIFYGPGPKEILEKYTRLAGRPAMVPSWSFGLWLSTSFTTHYDEKTVNEFIDGMAKRDIPLKVFHFDCFWMKGRHWCDFEWDKGAFPDPLGMLKRLKEKGLKVCLWINPYISQLSSLFGEGRDKGYFLKRVDGSVFQRDAWQPGMAIVDFTNPDACAWYCEKLSTLLAMGVDCFKTDFGEFIPTDVVYHDGSDPALMHNYYAYLYNKTVFELLEKFHGKRNALVFARSASVGSQKFPVHWGGDCLATFESMAEDLRGGLSFCLSGAAYWSHDIGGFSGKADPAIYKRWIAFGLLSTHSRLHGSESYRVPWLFDEESVDVMRHFARLKNRLGPYLMSAALDANRHGWPVMRAMVVEFPDDPAAAYLDRQYMLGSSLLVAPIFRHDGVAEYYVPAGTWTDLLSGEVVEGGEWYRVKMDFMHLPLLVRGNSVLPMSDDYSQPEWRFADSLSLNLFGVSDGADLTVEVPGAGGEMVARFRVRRKGNGVTIESDGRAKAVRAVMGGREIEWGDSKKALSFLIES